MPAAASWERGPGGPLACFDTRTGRELACPCAAPRCAQLPSQARLHTPQSNPSNGACPSLPCGAGDRQYFLSLRYGHVLDRPQLLALLEGRLAQQVGPEQAGAPDQGGSGGAMP